MITPAYISEVAPAKGRGALGSLQQLTITISQLVVPSANKSLAGAAGGSSHDLWLNVPAWRWMFPNGMRAMALALGAMSNWIFNLIVTFAFEPMIQCVKLTWFYGAFTFFEQRFVLETKRQELETTTGQMHQRRSIYALPGTRDGDQRSEGSHHER